MDFFACILILVIYYIRPMEWMPIFATLKIVTLTTLMGFIGVFYREQGLPALRRIFATPIDWMMAAFFAWIVFAAPERGAAWDKIKLWVFFYFIITQALTDHERIRKFLIGWSGVLLAVAVLALIPEIGIDPMGSYYRTHVEAKGRLVLNNSMFDNPNALGHSVAPLVLFIYFQLLWNRPIFMKEVAAVLLAIPAGCIYLTQSKGAYLTTFATFVVGQCFGRPKYVQAIVLALAVTAGWAGMKLLPRMGELDNPRTEAGVGGRLHTFKYGLELMNKNPQGVGWHNYWEKHYQDWGYNFASHSSYNECGAELGRFGLSLFLGVIYLCFRTLVTVRPPDTEMERSRRLLFCLIFSYALSSWMIDFLIRAYFFLIVAAISAYHRVLNETQTAPVPPPAAAPEPLAAVMPNVLPQNLMAPTAFGMPAPVAATTSTGGAATDAPAPARKLKTRPTIVDLLLIWALTEFWVWLWQYIIKNM
ncbi:MAG: hypothetical protein HZA89_06400 [Verrucomicrobia bacterium]|nr:hypothetical protein [Verrucomicrobiota bacterium]